MKNKFNYKPLLTALCLGLAALISAPAFADNPFQLDGNAISNEVGHPAGDDWDVVNTTGGNSEGRTGLVIDRPEPTQSIFTGGGAKDQMDITAWKWRTGTPPSKDDLTHAYAAAYVQDNNDFILVFGMDRYDTSGDAQLGFWFLKDKIQPVTGGTFSGKHQDGDVLVLVNFSNGGSVPTINVFQWQGGQVNAVGTGGAVKCTNGYIPAGQNFCGITNAIAVKAPWTYENKDVGLTDMFPPGAFFEGAINLTALLPNDSPCFTNFLAESRSSTSITATLKDFATPVTGFNVCKISVTKSCTQPTLNTAEDKIIYNIAGQVTNSGFGTVYNVALSDSPAADGAFQQVDCADPTINLGSFPLTSLANGETACYKNTMTVPLAQNGTKDTVTATANTADAGAGVALTDSAQAQCPNLAVSPAIQVTKDCSTALTTAGGNVAAKVNVTGTVCNIGDTRLDNVLVTDSEVSGSLIGPISLPKKGSTGDCVPYTGSYIPSAASDVNGVATTDPSKVVFKDTATATADDIFGAPVTPHTDEAQCPLCTCAAAGTCN